jgi:tetratricopeptide (TPR) repeat protein
MTAIADLLATAMQHHEAGHLPQAEQGYHRVLQQQPNQPNALYLLGLLAHQTGRLAVAVEWYQRAIAVKPDYVDAHNNLGAALQQQGNLEQAIAQYHTVLRLQPSNPHAQVNLGAILQQQGRLEAAIARYRKAIQLQPRLVQAHSNLGHALKQQGELEAAIACYRTALELTPDNPESHRDLGDALQEQGRIEDAISLYDRAIAQFPKHITLRGSRIRARLISGNLREGFAEYDQWRLGMAASPRPFAQPGWNGEELRGQTILLYSETGAGMGDAIQCIRYAPLVAQRGGRAIVECEPALVRLFQQVEGIEQVIAAGDSLPEFAVQVSLLSLPHIFGTTLETIPAFRWRDEGWEEGETCPPLSALRSPSSVLQIGIVWGGNPGHSNDRDRSCPLREFLPFLQLPGRRFYSLQKGVHREQLATIGDIGIQDLSDRLHDFADTAAAIAHLDLVITVDTAVAHLAGAMGKPVWILLSFYPDWRWLMQRQDSPWYPTARLFRQSRRNDWAGVCAQVTNALCSGDIDPSQNATFQQDIDP